MSNEPEKKASTAEEYDSYLRAYIKNEVTSYLREFKNIEPDKICKDIHFEYIGKYPYEEYPECGDSMLQRLYKLAWGLCLAHYTMKEITPYAAKKLYEYKVNSMTAEDVAQQTYEKYEKHYSYDKDQECGRNMRPWLYTIAKNIIKDAKRKETLNQDQDQGKNKVKAKIPRYIPFSNNTGGKIPDPGMTPDENAELLEFANLATAAMIFKLKNPNFGNVIILRIFEQLEFGDIAQKLGITVETCRNYLSIGFTKMKEILEDSSELQDLIDILKDPNNMQEVRDYLNNLAKSYDSPKDDSPKDDSKD